MSAITSSGALPERPIPRVLDVTLSSNLSSSMRPASASADISSLMELANRFVVTGEFLTMPATTATIRVETAAPRSAKSRIDTNASTETAQPRLFAHILESI
jgi:hypothetical protein